LDLHQQQLEHFVSRKAFDIDGLGEKVTEQLISEKLIEDAADLFELKYEDLVQLEFFKDKKAQNLLDSIEKAKIISAPRFIYALGIRYIGEETAEILADHLQLNTYEIEIKEEQKRDQMTLFSEEPKSKKITVSEIGDMIDYMQKLSIEDLNEIDGIGDKVADCIALFGFGQYAAFPIDVWTKRVLGLYLTPKDLTTAKMHAFAADHFGEYAGYAQQYLYHWMRTRSPFAQKTVARDAHRLPSRLLLESSPS